MKSAEELSRKEGRECSRMEEKHTEGGLKLKREIIGLGSSKPDVFDGQSRLTGHVVPVSQSRVPQTESGTSYSLASTP